MSNTLLRITVSIALGIALALPLVAATQFINVPVAMAKDCNGDGVDDGDCDSLSGNTLGEADLLPSDFSSATGLGQANLQKTIGNIINVILGFLGIVAVIIILWGGFKWMTAGGSDEKVQEARKLLIAGVIGLAIILSAYAITSFVISSLLAASEA